MPKILALAGSLRAESYNKRVVNIAAEGAREAGAEVTVIDLADFDLPVFNADDVERNGFNVNAYRLQDTLNVHDGFLFCSPEYNGGIPGGFKNAIDWASRANDRYATNQVFKGKTAALMAASPGAFGGIRGLAHLRGVMTSLGIWLLPSEIAVSGVAARFDGAGTDMTDEKMLGILKNHGAALVHALER